MTEVQASWVAQLPPRMRAAIEREDAKEAIAARAEQSERLARAEDWEAANMALFRAQAEARGEDISAMALARGELRGRSISDVLTEASRAGDAQDAREQARASREGDARAHVFVGEPVIYHGQSETGRAIFNRARLFRARVQAKRALAAAQEAELAEANQFPLQRPVELTRRSSVLEARDQRTGGPAPGYGPANVPWSTVAEWLARGWAP